MRDVDQEMTAFQTNGFQFNAFQIGFITGGAPPAAIVRLRMVMGVGQSIVWFLLFTLGV